MKGMTFMKKEELFIPIREKYDELKKALSGTDIEKIRELTLEVHAMVHPAEISGRTEKTIADYVLEYMLLGNQKQIFNTEWQKKSAFPLQTLEMRMNLMKQWRLEKG